MSRALATAQPAPPRSSETIPPAGLLQLLGAVVLLGGAWPITRYAVVAGASPSWFAEGRTLLSGLSAAVLLAVMGRLRLPVRRDLPALLAIGLLQLAGFFALVHAAVAWVPAGRTSILCNTTTIFVVPLSLLVLHETVSPRRWVAVAAGIAGIVLLMGPWAIDWSVGRTLLGHVFLLGAAACWGCTIIVVRRFPPRHSMLELLPWCFALASLALLPLAASHEPGTWSAGSLASFAYIGLVGGSIGTWCVMQASVTLPALVASLGFLASPAFGLLLSTLWLGEPLGPDLIAGAALILGGVAIAAWPRRTAVAA